MISKKSRKDIESQAKQDYDMTINALGEVLLDDEYKQALHLYPPLIHGIEEYMPGIDINAAENDVALTTLDIIQYGKKHKQEAEDYKVTHIIELIVRLIASQPVSA